MDILFDRQPRHDRVATDVATVESTEVARSSYFDSVEAAEVDTETPAPLDSSDLVDQVAYLTDEVEHLRACIDHMLDILDAQSHLADDVDLLFDRTQLSERRIQRIEDSAGGRDDQRRRRAEDAA